MIQIQIKYIPALFPDVDFSDRRLIDHRLEQSIENDNVIYKTEQKYTTTIYSDRNEERIIQSHSYPLYKILILSKEKSNYDLSQLAEEITIIDENDNEFRGVVLELNNEILNDTLMYRTIITIRKSDSNDYAISDYLSSTFLLQKYNTNQLNRFIFRSNKSAVSAYVSTASHNGTYYEFSIADTDFTDTLTASQSVDIYSSVGDNQYLEGTGEVNDVAGSVITIQFKNTAASGYTASELTIAWTATNAINFTLYTVLNELKHTPSTFNFIDEQTDDAFKSFSAVSRTKIKKARFYLSDDELKKLEYINFVKPYLNGGVIYFLDYEENKTYANQNNGELYTVNDRPELVGLHEVDILIPFSTSILNYYN